MAVSASFFLPYFLPWNSPIVLLCALTHRSVQKPIGKGVQGQKILVIKSAPEVCFFRLSIFSARTQYAAYGRLRAEALV